MSKFLPTNNTENQKRLALLYSTLLQADRRIVNKELDSEESDLELQEIENLMTKPHVFTAASEFKLPLEDLKEISESQVLKLKIWKRDLASQGGKVTLEGAIAELQKIRSDELEQDSASTEEYSPAPSPNTAKTWGLKEEYADIATPEQLRLVKEFYEVMVSEEGGDDFLTTGDGSESLINRYFESISPSASDVQISRKRDRSKSLEDEGQIYKLSSSGQLTKSTRY